MEVHEGKALQRAAKLSAGRITGFAAELGISRQVLYDDWFSRLKLSDQQREKAVDLLGSEFALQLQKPPIDIGEQLRNKKAFLPKEDEIEIPFFSSGVRATPGDNYGSVADVPAEYRRVSRHLFEDADGILPVYDYSMMPTYYPGQEIALKRDNSTFFDWGQVYVLLIDGSTIPIIKRIYQSDTKGSIQLYSDNIAKTQGGPRDGMFQYPPQDIELTMIMEKYIPIGEQGRRANKGILLRQLREQEHEKTS